MIGSFSNLEWTYVKCCHAVIWKDTTNCFKFILCCSPSSGATLITQNTDGDYLVTYTVAGEYTFSCTATDAEGNSDTEDVSATVLSGKYQ